MQNASVKSALGRVVMAVLFTSLVFRTDYRDDRPVEKLPSWHNQALSQCNSHKVSIFPLIYLDITTCLSTSYMMFRTMSNQPEFNQAGPTIIRELSDLHDRYG